MTSVGVFPNFWPKASERLCAGSVEISRTLGRHWANWVARAQLVVVLPTPPLPPTKIHLREGWSRMFWREGSGSGIWRGGGRGEGLWKLGEGE